MDSELAASWQSGMTTDRHRRASMPLEVLHRALVLLGGGAAGEGAEIAAAAGLRILFARIEPVFAGRQFADHGELPTKNVLSTRTNCAAIFGSGQPRPAKRKKEKATDGVAHKLSDLLFGAGAPFIAASPRRRSGEILRICRR